MNIITTYEQLDELVEHYLKQDAFAYDLETVGPNRGITVLNDVLWISLATHGRGDVIPLGHPNGDAEVITYPLTGQGEKRVAAGLPARPSDYSRDIKKATKTFNEPPTQLFPAEVFKRLQPLLFGDNRTVVGHNLVFDLTSIAKYYDGEVPKGPYFDTMVGSFIYDNKNKNKCGLDDCLAREFDYHMVKGVGKEVENYGFTTVATYAYLDAKYTFLLYKHLLPIINERKLDNVMNLEMGVLRVLCDMKLTGAPVDVENLQKLHDKLQIDIEEARARIYEVGKRVFNINSNPEKQHMLYGLKSEGGQGLKPKILTLKGQQKKDAGQTTTTSDYSVSAEALETYRGSNDLVDAMLEYADLNKLLSTYVIPYLGGDVTRTTNGKSRTDYKESLLVDGRIHCDFVQHGAETGRFSCVSGDTALPTNRGVFRFDEYVPHAGDMVMTHTSKWMPVLHKIYKGTDQMYEVRLENGSILHCTKYHRLLTYKGWVSLGDLNIGDSVASYGSIKEICEQLRESNSSNTVLYRGGQTHSDGSSATFEYHTPKCSCVFETGVIQRETDGGEIFTVFQGKTGHTKPYEGQVWLPASQLQGCVRELGWVSNGENRRKIRATAQADIGSSVKRKENTIINGRSPYKRGQERQRLGQLGFDDQIGPQQDALQESRIVEITPLGAMGVWDIGVAGDESYLAQGFINHNSRNPNLQNVPAPNTKLPVDKDYGTIIRNLFYAPEGYKLVVADYSQIEPRVIASMSKDPIMLKNYVEGGDLYTTIGNTMGIDRKAGKTLVLAIAYGVGPDKIAKDVGCSVTEAKELLNDFSAKFSAIDRYKLRVVAGTRAAGYVSTISGRKRYLPEINSSNYRDRSSAERQAFNTRIQGSAADIIKMAMVRLYEVLPKESKILLTVHDELVVLTPDRLADETFEAVRASMEGIEVLSVPLIADVKIVQRWGEAKG